MIRALLVLVLAAAMTLPAPLAAQQRGPQDRRGEVDREQLEQRMRAQMGRMMRERLGLSEQQATRLAEVVQDFDGRRRDLFVLEQATRRRVEALLLEGGDDEQEAGELLARMAALRVQEAELFRAEQEALLDVITPAQVLRLQSLREDLGRRIRQLRGGRNGDGTPGRRPGGPGPGAFRDGPGGPVGGAAGGPLFAPSGPTPRGIPL